MHMHMVTWLIAYFIFSFVVAAIYVRFAPAQKLAKFLRKHFYLFLLFPLVAPFLMGLWIASATIRLVFRCLRCLFERISGRKTYRRRSRYYHY